MTLYMLLEKREPIATLRFITQRNDTFPVTAVGKRDFLHFFFISDVDKEKGNFYVKQTYYIGDTYLNVYNNINILCSIIILCYNN